jgi:hypothetical protein
MKKSFIKGLTIGLSTTLLFVMISNKKIHCECCGELFNNNHTLEKDICDICYGYNERRGHEQNGYLLKLDDYDYYFSGLDNN